VEVGEVWPLERSGLHRCWASVRKVSESAGNNYRKALTLELLLPAGAAVEGEDVVLLEVDGSTILIMAVVNWFIVRDKRMERAEERTLYS
jgi:hypothetical protein